MSRVLGSSPCDVLCAWIRPAGKPRPSSPTRVSDVVLLLLLFFSFLACDPSCLGEAPHITCQNECYQTEPYRTWIPSNVLNDGARPGFKPSSFLWLVRACLHALRVSRMIQICVEVWENTLWPHKLKDLYEVRYRDISQLQVKKLLNRNARPFACKDFTERPCDIIVTENIFYRLL